MSPSNGLPPPRKCHGKVTDISSVKVTFVFRAGTLILGLQYGCRFISILGVMDAGGWWALREEGCCLWWGPTNRGLTWQVGDMAALCVPRSAKPLSSTAVKVAWVPWLLTGHCVFCSPGGCQLAGSPSCHRVVSGDLSCCCGGLPLDNLSFRVIAPEPQGLEIDSSDFVTGVSTAWSG